MITSARQAFALVREASRWELRFALVFEVLAALALVLVLGAGRAVVESLTADEAALRLSDVAPEILLLGLGLAISGVSASLVGEFRTLVGLQAARETQRRIVAVSTSVRYEQFETPRFHDLLQRANSEGAATSHQMVVAVLALTNIVLTSLGIAAVLVITVPSLLLALLLVAVPFLLAARGAARLGYLTSYHLTPSDRLRAYLYRALTAREEAKEIRVLGLAPALTARWEDLHEERMSRMRRLTLRRSILNGAAALASAAVVTGVLLLLVDAAVDQRIALADAAVAMVALQQLAGRIRSAASNSGSLQQSALFMRDLQSFLGMAGPQTAGQAAVPHGPLVLQDVSFTYPGTEREVLHDISLEIGDGEIVGVVGVSGSGKTTLANLVARLYQPTSGSINYGGVDLAEIDSGDYWPAVAPVFQDYARYELTARENVGLSSIDRMSDDEAILAALDAAGLSHVVDRLSDGLETTLSRSYTDGTEISVGQWQRFAVARAFFRNSPVLILDEPASALDAEAERSLFETLSRLAAERSVLLISHRFSTVRMAHRIVVMHDGSIVEEGTHEQLLAEGGRYAELYRLQVSGLLGDDPESQPPAG